MKFRMNDLENFLEVATCRTMSDAAKKLGITQPALSESMKRLEKDLNAILLYRSRSGTQLTPTGRAIFTNAKNALSFLSEIETTQDEGKQFGLRMITIGCHSTVASYFVPTALKILEKNAPDFKINLKHGLSRDIQLEVQQGMIDIGIVVNPNPSPDLIIREIGKDEIAVWSAKNSSKDRVFCNPDLMQTQSILKKWKLRPVHQIHTTSLELIARLTDAGLGFGILPARMVELLGMNLRKLDTGPTYSDSLRLVYRTEFGKAPIEREVIRALEASARA